jgi:hypothetical protein
MSTCLLLHITDYCRLQQSWWSRVSRVFLAFVSVTPKSPSTISPQRLVMDKFGSELWFEPEPPRTEPEVQFKVLKNG